MPGSFLTRIVVLVAVSVMCMSCVTYKGMLQPSQMKDVATGTGGLLYGTYTRDFSELLRYPAARLIVKDSHGNLFDLYLKMREKNQKGVFVFDLPAGQYTFARIMYEYNQPGQYYVKQINSPFIVKPGKRTYVGSIAFMGGIIPAALATDITMTQAEDTQLLLKQFTDIDTYYSALVPHSSPKERKE